jgi:tetratricopeptide (TPR) repeat protein
MKREVAGIALERSSMKTTNADEAMKAIDLLCDSGQFDLAISALDKLLVSNPGSPKLWARRGWCKYSKRKFREAILDFDEALSRKPLAPTALYFRAKCYEEIGDLENAVRDYSASISIRPKSDAHIARGLIHKYSNRSAPAKADFEEALRLDPGNTTAAQLLSDK